MGKTQAGPASGTKGVQESSLGQPSQVDVVQKPVEMLLVGASSLDPFSTIVVDPRTGVSAWSYKGSELQGASAGRVVPLGSNGDHFLIAVKDRPLLSCLAVHNRDRFHAKSVVAGPISSLVSSRDGTLLFVAIATKIYIYLLTTGELLSVVDAHYQPIARLGLSSDEALLVSASNDGAVHVYLVSELVSTDRERNVKPLRKWQAHTLPIRGLSVGLGQDPRIATCGIDHTATVHSICLDSSLLKISADRPLTSCTLDPAESRLFVGSDLGNIAQINLYSVGLKSEILIQTSDERNESVPVFNSHSDEISGLAINGDGALLASGDVTGKYCLWEIGSRQCLRVSTMRGAISTLSFIPNWPTLSSSEHTTVWRPVFDLHRNPSDSGNVQLAVRKKDNHDMARWSSLVDRLLETQSGQLVDSSKAMKTKKTTEQTASSSSQNGIDDEIQLVETPKKATSSESIDNEDDPADERIKKLLEENKKLRKINAELYSFAAKTIME